MKRQFIGSTAIIFAAGLYVGYYVSNHKQQILPIQHAQVFFTPGDDCTSVIVQTIDQAKLNIYIQAYGFTSLPIAQAIVRAAERGVRVQILLDKSNLTNTTPAFDLVQSKSNIVLKIDHIAGIAHNKVMIIDDILITGSFNFTHSAQHRNTENIIKIHEPKITQRYLANWNHRELKAKSMTNHIITTSSTSMISKANVIESTSKSKHINSIANLLQKAKVTNTAPTRKYTKRTKTPKSTSVYV